MLEQLNDSFNILNLLIRKYCRGSLNFCLPAELIQELNWSQQEKFINATIKNPLVKKYPVKRDFSKLFLKKLIRNLEESQEVHDELYASLCLVMEDDTNQNFYFRHYIIGNDLNNVVTVRETNNMVVNGTTGMRTWEAAVMLSDWALCNNDVFKNKTVLELGSGVGFTGITIGKFCETKNILLTDCHEDVLESIEHNIAVNFPSWHCKKSSGTTMFETIDKKIGVMNLDWNEISEIPAEIYPDVVIGADIIYDPTILEPLLNVIKHFVQKNESLEIFIAGVIRNEETYNMFLERLDTYNLQYQKLVHARNNYIEWDCEIQTYLLKISKI